MNAWYMTLIYLAATVIALGLCAAAAVLCGSAIIKKKRLGMRFPALLVSMVLLAAVLLFTKSHGTYIRFNDWWISMNGAQKTAERYGAPELGGFTDGKSGSLGYYIYTDDGPIMPDHLEHYYYVEYDEQGNVTEIYDGTKPGG